MKNLISMMCLVVMLAGSLNQVGADTVVQNDPLNPGLAPGETFHLAFVTDGVRNVGYSVSVGACNTFVTGQASLAGSAVADLGMNWSAIISTGSSLPSTHAYDNALVSAPVYLIDGTPVATGYADFWDGSLASPINVSQFGEVITSGTNNVWTGSHSNGQKHTYWPIGAALTEYGYLTVSDSRWIESGYHQFYYEGPYRMYALSPVMTVAPVPVPGAAILGMIGIGMAGAYTRKRRQADVAAA